jgi:predicted nucleic acid-binding protein
MKRFSLVDSNVILDVITDDPILGRWSSETLVAYRHKYEIAINPVIYAEVSIRFSTAEELEEILPINFFKRLPIPYEAAFLAGKCYMKYKERGGLKTNVLPDFLIGAHAVASNMILITRDVSRYSDYFPNLELVTP